MKIYNTCYCSAVMRTLLALCFLSTALFAEDKADKEPQPVTDVASPMQKMTLEDGDCIVFFGDSITHQCLYTQYFENYIYTRFPKKRIRMHNSGVSGAKAWDGLQRFDEDVAKYKPKYVTVLLGMNDGEYQKFNSLIFKTYQQDMKTIVEKIKATSATPILMTPTMWDARARRMNPRRKTDYETVSQYNAVMAYYGAWMREIATQHGYGYIDMYGPLNQLTFEARKKNAKFTMIKDAIHPDPPGQVVMAVAMVADLGLPRQLSNIRIIKKGDNRFRSRAAGGKVSGLIETKEGIEFTWLANSLPWVLPENAAEGVKMTHLGHRYTREALLINGLSPGHYELQIDGVKIGVYSSEKLAQHIELQGNSKTPQYQQATQVATLNAKRNSKSIKKLRGQWSVFQRYSRFERMLKQAEFAGLEPTAEQREKLKGQVAAYKKRLIGMDERVKELNAAAKKIEDEIFKINQPVPRKYTLKRVAAPVKRVRRKKQAAPKRVPAIKASSKS